MNDINVPLKKKLPPKTFSELGIIGVNLFVSIAYSDTQFEKTGIQALLGKLPVLKNLTPFKSPMCSMDIDLSCVALDRQGKALDVIWYGNLRNDTQSIRYSSNELYSARWQDNHRSANNLSYVDIETRLWHKRRFRIVDNLLRSISGDLVQKYPIMRHHRVV